MKLVVTRIVRLGEREAHDEVQVEMTIDELTALGPPGENVGGSPVENVGFIMAIVEAIQAKTEAAA